jgi:hypothetical protein
MKRFDIILKNEKEKTYRFIIFLFVVLHILFFCYLLFDEQLWKKGVGGLVIILLYSGYRLLITNTRHQKFSFGSGIFFFLMSIFPNDSWWFWGTEMVLFTLSSIALIPITIYFTISDVKKTGNPPKTYQWKEFSNILIKDNILTLDFKNNKLMQAEIASQNIHEHDFNTFATEQIAKSN